LSRGLSPGALDFLPFWRLASIGVNRTTAAAFKVRGKKTS